MRTPRLIPRNSTDSLANTSNYVFINTRIHRKITAHKPAISNQRTERIRIHREICRRPLHRLIHGNKIFHGALFVHQRFQSLSRINCRTIIHTTPIGVNRPQVVVGDIENASVCQRHPIHVAFPLGKHPENLGRRAIASKHVVTSDKITSKFPCHRTVLRKDWYTSRICSRFANTCRPSEQQR